MNIDNIENIEIDDLSSQILILDSQKDVQRVYDSVDTKDIGISNSAFAVIEWKIME